MIQCWNLCIITGTVDCRLWGRHIHTELTERQIDKSRETNTPFGWLNQLMKYQRWDLLTNERLFYAARSLISIPAPMLPYIHFILYTYYIHITYEILDNIRPKRMNCHLWRAWEHLNGIYKKFTTAWDRPYRIVATSFFGFEYKFLLFGVDSWQRRSSSSSSTNIQRTSTRKESVRQSGQSGGLMFFGPLQAANKRI